MSHGEVATISHIVDMTEKRGQPTEVGGLARADTSARRQIIGHQRAVGPVVAAGAVALRVLFAVLRFVDGERGRTGMFVHLTHAWPPTMLAAGHVFHVRGRPVVGIPCPVPRRTQAVAACAASRVAPSLLRDVLPRLDVDRGDAMSQRLREGDCEVGMVGHINATVAASISAAGQRSHIATTQSEGSHRVAVLA